jgi:hypothetical protein
MTDILIGATIVCALVGFGLSAWTVFTDPQRHQKRQVNKDGPH